MLFARRVGQCQFGSLAAATWEWILSLLIMPVRNNCSIIAPENCSINIAARRDFGCQCWNKRWYPRVGMLRIAITDKLRIFER